MRGLALCCLVAITIGQARASDLSSAKAREAMRLCTAVDPDAGGQMAAIEKLDRAVAVAQSAIDADDSDAHAHLALFCGLGRQLEIAGLSWRSFGRLASAHEAIDRASSLAPEDPDVLVARGAFISGIPRPLGGNRALGEKLLAHALTIAPDHVAARLHLAKSMAARHAPEARLRAYEAIAAAKKAGAAREQAEAAKLLASIAK